MMQATRDYDSKLFGVASLLSSTLLYNTVKLIDDHALDSLHLLAWQANLFSLKARLSEGKLVLLGFRVQLELEHLMVLGL